MKRTFVFAVVIFFIVIWQYKVINICHNINEINDFEDKYIGKAIEDGTPLSSYFIARDNLIPTLDKKIEFLNNLLRNEYKTWELHEINGCNAIIKKATNY